MEIGKRYDVAGITALLLWTSFWYGPYGADQMVPYAGVLAFGIGFGAVLRGE
jgi:hypothetical protein